MEQAPDEKHLKARLFTANARVQTNGYSCLID